MYRSAYSSLLRHWLQAGRTDKVKEVFLQMRCIASVQSVGLSEWSTYLSALAQAGELDAVMQGVQQMLQEGVTPDESLCTALMQVVASESPGQDEGGVPGDALGSQRPIGFEGVDALPDRAGQSRPVE